MAGRLRVFVVGLTQEDLAALRVRVSNETTLTVVGGALLADVEERRVTVPDDVAAVMMTAGAAREAAARRSARLPRQDPAESLIEELTPRERDVLALLADGYGNRAIAERLGVSEHTVKFHLTSIFGKLGASTRTEAVRKGLELGIVDL